jgi:hypothetical protein
MLPVTWTLDGFQFNVGADSQGHSTIVDVPEWDNAPGPKPRFVEKTEGHGAYSGPSYREGKPMTIVGTAQAVSPQAREILRDRLAALCLDENTLYPLTCSNPYRDQDLTSWVTVYDTPDIRRQPDGVSLTLDIPLFAPDPWKYSTPNDAVATGLASPGLGGILWNGSPSASGGIEWNGSPTVSGGWIYEEGGGASGIMRLINSGTRPAPITFTITSEAINPLLVAVQTQQRLRWLGVVSGPNYLTIDTNNRKVTLGSDDQNRVSVDGSLVESDFFMVPAQGYIDVEYSDQSTPGASSSQAIAVNSNVYA